MPEPVNTALYNRVKEMATKKFSSPTGAYRSMWIVKKYKELGGTYRDDNKPKKLHRWLNEKWVNVNAKKEGGGYEECGKRGSSGKYPLCRPSVSVSSETPKRVQDIPKSRINAVNLKKQKLQNKGNIKF
jgi:hypothetical protein